MKVIVERDLEARMHDGTVLRADVYRPDGPGKFPVVLQRTPYDKQREIFLIPTAGSLRRTATSPSSRPTRTRSTGPC